MKTYDVTIATWDRRQQTTVRVFAPNPDAATRDDALFETAERRFERGLFVVLLVKEVRPGV